MKSKLAILLLSLTSMQCLPLSRDPVIESFDNCANEAKMNAQTIRDSLNSDTFLEPTSSYYKFLECHYTNQNFLNNQGYVDYKVIKESASKIFEASLVDKLVNSCENVQNGTSPGERAYNAAKCLFNNLKSIKSELELEQLSPDQVKESIDNCANKSKMNAQTIRDSLDSDTFLEPTNSYYEFFECHYTNQHFLNSQGHVDYKVIKESTSNIFKPSLADKLVNSCENIQNGTRPGERAYNAAKCLFNNFKAVKSELELDQLKQKN